MGASYSDAFRGIVPGRGGATATKAISVQPSPAPDEPDELETRAQRLRRFRGVVSEVLDGFLFVSGLEASRDTAGLASLGITHVVNCCAALGADERATTLQKLRLYMYDSKFEDLSCYLYDVLDFAAAARGAGGKVLVHCEKGVSRSCALAIAIVMAQNGPQATFRAALELVRSRRAICEPNIGFQCQLIEWEERRRMIHHFFAERRLSVATKADTAPDELEGSPPFAWRVALHGPEDHAELRLKLCLPNEPGNLSRTPVVPCRALLDSRTCYILFPPVRKGREVQDTQAQGVAYAGEGGDLLPMWIWVGRDAATDSIAKAMDGLRQLREYDGIGHEHSHSVAREESEPEAFGRFLATIAQTFGTPPANAVQYGDLDGLVELQERSFAGQKAARKRHREADQTTGEQEMGRMGESALHTSERAGQTVAFLQTVNAKPKTRPALYAFSGGTWQLLEPYTEGDLEDGSLFILLRREEPPFLLRRPTTSLEAASLALRSFDAEEVREGSVVHVLAHEEPDEFWDAFDEGCL